MTLETYDKKSLIQNFKEQNVKIIPVKPKSKVPDIPDFGKYLTGEKVFNSTIRADQNYGAVCGAISDNLVIIDIEKIKPEDYHNKHPNPEHIPVEDDFINKIIPYCKNKTFTTKTGSGGFHISVKGYKIPNKTSSYVYEKDENNIYQIDFKVTGHCVEAGSIHENGRQYEMVSNVRTIQKIDLQNILVRMESVGFKGIKTETDEDDFNNWSIDELSKGGWVRGERRRKQKSLYCMLRRERKTIPEVRDIITKINSSLAEPLEESELEINFEGAERFFQNTVLPKYGYIRNDLEDEKQSISKNKDVIDVTAKAILTHHDFITLRESNETLLYDGKIYSKAHAESIIKEETEQIIENCTTHDRNEVVNKIKAKTGKDIEEFDKDPLQITTESGILNLDTLKENKHNPQYLTRVLLPISYVEPIHPINNETIFEDLEKNLKETLFWKFLKSSFTVDEVFKQKEFETCLEIVSSFFIKQQIDEKAFLFLGKGENGKSVLLEYIENMLGEKNVSKIPLQEITEDRFMRAELDGMSANIYSDLEVNELKETGKFKAIASNEGIQAQKKYGQPFILKPFVKLLFSCNRFPKVYDQSQGFFRRWIIVKWERDFENDPERDEHLKEKLKSNVSEKNLVFSCLVHLAQKINQEGKFTHSKDWKTIQKEWNENADPLDDFVNNYILDSDEDTTVRETYHFYKEIMLSKNERPLGIGQFGKGFSEYYDQDKIKDGTKTKKVWLNIALKRPVQVSMEEFER